jgi:hypothetical protein
VVKGDPLALLGIVELVVLAAAARNQAVAETAILQQHPHPRVTAAVRGRFRQMHSAVAVAVAQPILA